MEGTKERIVVVSGGSSGLGLATSKVFIQEGATVIVASRSRKKFLKNLGEENPCLRFIETDYNDMESVRRLYQKIQKEFGSVDIAINNVGYAGINSIGEYSEEDFDRTFNINLKSLWMSMKYQLPLMLEDAENDKFIINISSLNGLGGAEYLALYAAAKAGVISLTKSAALEYAGSNITFNSIIPGPFETPMLHETLNFQAAGDLKKKKLIEQQYKQLIPEGRFGDPEELAQTILWLCQGKNKFMSGQSIIMDGGLSSRFR